VSITLGINKTIIAQVTRFGGKRFGTGPHRDLYLMTGWLRLQYYCCEAGAGFWAGSTPG